MSTAAAILLALLALWFICGIFDALGTSYVNATLMVSRQFLSITCWAAVVVVLLASTIFGFYLLNGDHKTSRFDLDKPAIVMKSDRANVQGPSIPAKTPTR